MDCIDNIIGVSKKGCDCITATPGDSLSGLFLDDTTEGRIPLTAALYDCSDVDTVDFLNRVVVEAKDSAIEQLSMALEKHFIRNGSDAIMKVPRKPDYSTGISGSHYIFSIRPIKPNMTLEINDFDIQLVTGTFGSGNTIEIYKGANLYANVSKAELAAGYTIKLDSDIHFKFQTAHDVRNIKSTCCSMTHGGGNFVRLGGSAGGELEFVSTEYTYGVQMNARIYCDPFIFMCNFNYTQGWGLVFAKLVQLIARKNLAAYLIDSGKVTTYTTLNEDRIYDLLNWYGVEIDKRLDFLPTKYTFSDCFCNSRHIQGSIIV